MKSIAVIGAGLGGLVAGNLLARKGYKVTIFESHDAPGGYTAGFRRKGFYFESGTLSFESSSLVFNTLKDIGVYDKLTFEHHRYRFITSDYDGTPATFEQYKKMLMDAYPQQVEPLRRYFKEIDALYRPMAGYMSGSRIGKYKAMAALALLYVKHRGRTITEFTSRYFPRGTPLYHTLTNLGYPEMSALFIGGAFYTLFEDYWTVKEGFQALADVLAERFKQNGGTLRLHSPVDKITLQNGTATGVVCKGEEIPADIVISACDYKHTFLSLLDSGGIAPDTLDKVRDTAVSEGVCTVYLGLSLSNDELLERLKASLILYDETGQDLNIYESGDDPAYFEKAAFSIHHLSEKCASLAPQGKSSIMLQAGAPYHWMDNWGGGDRKRYLELKKQVMETFLQRFEARFTGITRAIEFKDMATPRTYERYTKNTDGATSAWSWNPKNKFYKKMMGVYVDTPVKNLYIGSCWATQIGGLPGAINAAYKCVKKIG
ncbi:MAG: phytoene desaturase family protein [Chitinispirillaceae bacterium]